jgi:hypothetical protein
MEPRQEARRLIADIVRAIDRRLTVEVREAPDPERLQLTLTHGTRQGRLELKQSDVVAAADDSVARNALRLRVKRTADAMLFRPMPDHRLAVKAIAPPGGQMAPRGRSRGRR